MQPVSVSRTRTAQQVLSLEEAWLICADLYEGLPIQTARPGSRGIEDELLFCLLGGFGISYELNRSAAEVVARLAPFSMGHDEGELRSRLEMLLRGRNFEPRRADGGLRRFRFPVRKAAMIVAARRWLHQQPPLDQLLPSLGDDRERRAHMCTCPGVGPKTASWLLRNLGLARELAVLDVHVVRALSESGRLHRGAVLPRDYERVEQAFLGWCKELGADPCAFDLFVWEWQRGTLSAAAAP